MSDCKHVFNPIPFGAKLTKTMSPITPIEQLDMQDVPCATIVGKFMYLVTTTWLDLAYMVDHCTQFMANHGPLHWATIKKKFRYLKHSSTWGFCLLCKR